MMTKGSQGSWWAIGALGGVLVALAHHAARAATTYTAPVSSVGGSQVSCMVHNASEGPEAVMMRLRGQDNVTVMTSERVFFPGEVAGIATSADVIGANCVFEHSGDPSRVRGQLRLTEAVNEPTMTISPTAGQALTTTPTAVLTTSYGNADRERDAQHHTDFQCHGIRQSGDHRNC